jgi:hypothetical protein
MGLYCKEQAVYATRIDCSQFVAFFLTLDKFLNQINFYSIQQRKNVRGYETS